MAVQRAGDTRNEAQRETANEGVLLGRSGRERSIQEQQESHAQAEERGSGNDLRYFNQRRFWLGDDEVADFVILDYSDDDCAFIYEHQMQGTDGRWNIFELCPRDYDLCPICDTATDNRGKSSYKMFLTGLDLRGYTNREGEFVPHVKRSLPVPQSLHAEFFRIIDAAKKEYGTIRGLHILLSRKDGVRERIGKPVMFEDGKMFEVIPEAELQAEFGHEEIRAADGTLLKAKDFDITPYTYMKIFHRNTGEELRRRYGRGAAPAGSQQEMNDTWGAGQRGTAPRTRSRFQATSGTQDGHHAAASGPVAPRTRTREQAAPQVSHEPAGEPASAPAPRTRARQATAPATAAAPATQSRSRVRRSASSIPSAEELADIPFDGA